MINFRGFAFHLSANCDELKPQFRDVPSRSRIYSISDSNARESLREDLDGEVETHCLIRLLFLLPRSRPEQKGDEIRQSTGE